MEANTILQQDSTWEPKLLVEELITARATDQVCFHCIKLSWSLFHVDLKFVYWLKNGAGYNIIGSNMRLSVIFPNLKKEVCYLPVDLFINVASLPTLHFVDIVIEKAHSSA